MKVLIVKLSSMGDLVQALPALSDAARAIPDIQFEWAVDESFAEIPLWHPAVTRTVVSAHRRWRTGLLNAARAGELRHFWRDLRRERYDRVIDAQGSLKSALVTRMARGARCGPARSDVREFGAHWAYEHRFSLGDTRLAVDRHRRLFSQALGYEAPSGEPDFALEPQNWPRPADLPRRPYLVFVTQASWATKCWPDANWQALLARAQKAGYPVLLPWGSPAEHQRVQMLAREAGEGVTVLPHMNLTQLAGVLKNSAGAVCNDTGLAHIAAALAVPTVTLYGPTDPQLIGATGPHSRHLFVQGFACAPCYRRRCRWRGYRGGQAQCLKALGATHVWEALAQLQARGEACVTVPG